MSSRSTRTSPSDCVFASVQACMASIRPSRVIKSICRASMPNSKLRSEVEDVIKVALEQTPAEALLILHDQGRPVSDRPRWALIVSFSCLSLLRTAKACHYVCCWHLNRLSHTDTGKSRDQCRSFLCDPDGFGRGDHAALHICHAHQMPSMWWSRLHAQREEQNASFPSNPVQMRILQADTLDEVFCLRQPVS